MCSKDYSVILAKKGRSVVFAPHGHEQLLFPEWNNINHKIAGKKRSAEGVIWTHDTPVFSFTKSYELFRMLSQAELPRRQKS